jgi:hypothetical protein
LTTQNSVSSENESTDSGLGTTSVTESESEDDDDGEICITKSQALTSLDNFKHFMLQNDLKEGYVLAQKLEKLLFDHSFVNNMVQRTLDSYF